MMSSIASVVQILRKSRGFRSAMKGMLVNDPVSTSSPTTTGKVRAMHFA